MGEIRKPCLQIPFYGFKTPCGGLECAVWISAQCFLRLSCNLTLFWEPVTKPQTGFVSGKPRDVESWIDIKSLLFP